jgi:glycosyltransferase domain-containing protein
MSEIAERTASLTALETHTLVIPTYNRPELLERLVAFYAEATPQMSLLVLDSSEPATAQANAGMIARRAASARHIAFPTTLPMAEKLALGLGEVETLTASFCADDDIVFPEGLASAVTFLAGNPDYVSAHGVYLNFREDGANVHLHVEYSGPGIEADHPGARIFKLMQGYESLFYGAFRASDLRDIFAETGKIPSLHYQELMQSVAALIKGKVKRFDGFYAGRRSGPEAEPGRTRWQTYYWFADDAAEFVNHYVDYRERAWGYYQRQVANRPDLALAKAEFDRMMNITHALYFSKTCPPSYFYSRLEHLWPNDKLAGDVQGIVSQRTPLGFGWVAKNIVRIGKGLNRRLRGVQPSRLAPLINLYGSIARRKVTKLDREVTRNTRKAWKAEMEIDWVWLAGDPGFRKAYTELCRYLDGPGD